jgi:prepilin-type processing-associated H-X9-DG protein
VRLTLDPSSDGMARRSSIAKYVIQTAIIAVVLWVGLTAAWNTRQVQNRMKCSENLTRIGAALSAYRAQHPEGSATLDALVEEDLIRPGERICPALKESRSNYRLADPRAPNGPDQVLVYEPLANHRSGANVLFADGKCKFVPADKFKELNLPEP